MYDVIVVGAGPVGSRIAGELARRGHKVIVLEQHASIGKVACCTGIVGRECIESFPIARQAVVREAQGARFFSPMGASFVLRKDAAQAYILDRQTFDSAMAAEAQALVVEYLLGTKVKEVVVGGDEAYVEAESHAQTLRFRGSVVVLASGFNSRLPAKLGMGRIDDFVMGAQVEVETGIEEVEVYFGGRFAPGFFAWLVPTHRGRALVGLLSRRNTGEHLKVFIEWLLDQDKISPPRGSVRFGGIQIKPLRHTSSHRVIVVGDAAGQVKPTTGGGIYYGMLCADIAVDVLDRAIAHKDFSNRFLSEYERRWKKLLAGELRICRCARLAFERLSDKQTERLFHMVESSSATESLLNAPDFSFDWHSRLIVKALWRFGPRAALSLILGRR